MLNKTQKYIDSRPMRFDMFHVKITIYYAKTIKTLISFFSTLYRNLYLEILKIDINMMGFIIILSYYIFRFVYN
jgi:hypothetical protein